MRRAWKKLTPAIREYLKPYLVRLQKEDRSLDLKRLNAPTYALRLRVGDYRITFEVDEARLILTKVAHRKDIYR